MGGALREDTRADRSARVRLSRLTGLRHQPRLLAVVDAVPDTRYAKSGDVRIAYQVFGEGQIDLVWDPRLRLHVEFIGTPSRPRHRSVGPGRGYIE